VNYVESLFSLKGKTAIVTGAARGNGRAIAEGLYNAGANVVFVDVIAESLKGEVEDYFTCDVADKQSLEKLVNFVLKKYEKIDILVNNAGVSFGHDLLEYPDEYWNKTYEVNLKGPYELIKLVARSMKEQKSGTIINITSLNAELAFPDNPAYVAFKGALKQLTKSVANDLGMYGIRANNIGPGYIKTDMTKESWNDPNKNKQRKNKTVLGRWGTPDDLVGAAVFLASNASSFITGQDLYVDGGWTIKGL